MDRLQGGGKEQGVLFDRFGAPMIGGARRNNGVTVRVGD
jgi:hypothetical protein